MNIKHKLLAVAVTAALSGYQCAQGATIIVTTSGDPLLGDPLCTLRSAVSAANTNVAVGGCTAGSDVEPDVIEFSPTLFGDTITLSGIQIDLSSSMTIDASAASRRGLTISGDNSSRLFAISNGGDSTPINVTLRGLTLTQGFVSGENGGAITNDGEIVQIDDCILTGNQANDLASPGSGGAIENFGQMTLTNSTVSGNTASNEGGGIINLGASLTLNSTTVTNNFANNGGGIRSQAGPGASQPDLLIRGGTISNNEAASFGGGISAYNIATLLNTNVSNNRASYGGAVSMFSPNTELVITNTELTENFAAGDGGAVANSMSGIITITNSEFRNNRAGFIAGAIYSRGPTTISDTLVTENVAAGGGGGGIRHSAGYNLTITNSQLTLNESSESGAGIHAAGPVVLRDSSLSGNVSEGNGGGVFAQSGLSVTRSTINDNIANNGGAFFATNSSTALLSNATVSSNVSSSDDNPFFPAAIYTAGALVIRNSSLVQNGPNGLSGPVGANSWNLFNTVIVDSEMADCVDAGTYLSQNINNFIADGSCSADAENLMIGDPMLGPLSNNGGPTNTHAPLSGSPLVDVGDIDECADEDQTGMPRPIDGNSDEDSDCDIGSVEFVDLFPPLANLTSAPSVTRPGDTSYEIQVTYTDLDGAVNFASVGPADITVLPGPLAVQSVALSGTTSQLIATYTLTPPGGAWVPSDSGSYTLSVNADEVVDTATTGVNSVPASQLGGFTVAIPDLEVAGNGVAIAAGDDTPSTQDNTDFSDVPLQNARSRTFTISNVGAGSIDLTDPVAISGEGFTVSQPAQSALNAGDSTEFQVTFAPTVLGAQTGTVTIVTNLSDENPYTFAVEGNGVAAQSQIFADSFESP
ncbi:MAG: choice-of-anchor Q domain-containing protein [Lysobacterales bacterium]